MSADVAADAACDDDVLSEDVPEQISRKRKRVESPGDPIKKILRRNLYMCFDLATIVHFANARLDSLARIQKMILSALSDPPDTKLTSLAEIRKLFADEVENATQLFIRCKDSALEAMTAQEMLVGSVCKMTDPWLNDDLHERKAIWSFLCQVKRFNNGVIKPPAKTDNMDVATDVACNDDDVLLEKVPAQSKRRRKTN